MLNDVKCQSKLILIVKRTAPSIWSVSPKVPTAGFPSTQSSRQTPWIIAKWCHSPHDLQLQTAPRIPARPVHYQLWKTSELINKQNCRSVDHGKCSVLLNRLPTAAELLLYSRPPAASHRVYCLRRTGPPSRNNSVMSSLFSPPQQRPATAIHGNGSNAWELVWEHVPTRFNQRPQNPIEMWDDLQLNVQRRLWRG